MNKIQKLISLVRPYYPGTDPAHDWAHIGRVAANAQEIASNERANLPCVLAAVYCHDLVNLPKNHPDRKQASALAAQMAHPLLLKSGFTEVEIALIQSAIIEHSFSKNLRPSTIEGGIVQDADRLDALGAIGILRCAAISSQMKTSFYDPIDPLAKDRELDDKAFMLDHYFIKLFKLSETMNTNTGKLIAIERVSYMKEFIKQLWNEAKFHNY